LSTEVCLQIALLKFAMSLILRFLTAGNRGLLISRLIAISSDPTRSPVIFEQPVVMMHCMSLS
jgi:hypothetical protein